MNEKLEETSEPREYGSFEIWRECMKEYMNEFNSSADASYALYEELFDSAYQISEERIKAALMYLFRDTDIDDKLLFDTIKVMHKFSARKQCEMAEEVGYKKAMKGIHNNNLRYLRNEFSELNEK